MGVVNQLDFSKTQRIVLLIDLNPLLRHLHNPKPNLITCLTPLLTSIKTLLSFPPLSHSLSSFKLFFSSLSPLLSSSTLLKLRLPSSCNPNSLSFNHPNETLISLSETLNSLSNLKDCAIPSSKARAEHMSSSIAQVIHDYAWDLNDSDESSDGSNLVGLVRSNLVVLFSPVCRSFDDLSDFMGGVGHDVLSDCDAFCDKFRGVFGCVKDSFLSRDINFSWVDVRYETESSKIKQSDELDEYGGFPGMFKKGVKGLGWGFCSSDSIVFGSALVSFGLIYPMIGVSSNCCNSNAMHKNISGQLNLEILDVSGKPLECKCCDLQLLDVKAFHGHRPDMLLHLSECGNMGAEICQRTYGMWERFSESSVKIDVKAICRHCELVKMEDQISDVVLVNELSVDSKKSKEERSIDFFADRVIDLLLKETGELVKSRSPPLWQILLSFLYRRGYWALVSISNADGNSTRGVLRPFSIDSAYLFILKGDAETHCGAEFDIGMDSTNKIPGGESRRKHKKYPYRYKDFSWSSFCKAAYGHCEMELEEAYFSKGCDTSKKLKFLKCWMKQIVKNSLHFPCKPEIPKIYSEDQEKVEHRLKQLHQECDQPLPLAEEDGAKATPQVGDAAASLPVAADAFFSNLSERIQHGVESGVDLVAFSHRIVRSCIYWLSRRLDPHINEGSQASVEKSDGSSCGGLLAGELMKLLLQDPKDVAGRHKDSNISSKSHDAKVFKMFSGDKVREYELQILFRMEILQSEIAVGIRESIKQKFVKQICSLLEAIQCNMEDGFFGDFNLNDYVSRILRSRYSQNLGGIIHSICEQMDLLLFDDEDESPNPLLNSEDSNQSWRVGDNDRGSEPNSTDSFSGPLRGNGQNQRETGRSDHDRKLVEAQERRERALRFASFTRRAMPELQRVWAPKPNKLSRSQSDSFRRSKRKNRQRESCDMVCETPMSGAKKCLFPSEDSTGDQDCWGQGGSSVPRALFQDRSLDLD